MAPLTTEVTICRGGFPLLKRTLVYHRRKPPAYESCNSQAHLGALEIYSEHAPAAIFSLPQGTSELDASR